jgi:DNA modification methylase
MQQTPFFETKNGKLYKGDCLELLAQIPTAYLGAAKAIITDPPYGVRLSSSGDGSSKTSLWTEIENLAHFYTMWFRECYKILKDDAFLAVFGNFKSIPALYKAFLMSGFTPVNAVVWDKEHIGPGMIGFRASYEIVAIGIKGNAES